MEEIINQIIKNNSFLFGNSPSINRINIGFTNTLYNINDLYIVKICTDLNNEEKFKKEIKFYNANKDSSLIPKLYYSNIDKDKIPYMYEIIEKIDGVPLFSIWHKLNETDRENVIKELCNAMKMFHSNKGEQYDWKEKTNKLFLNAYDKVNSLNIFSEEEKDLINKAYLKFEDYLDSDEFVLVHNDLHFDNIFYKDGRIKLIDFERSLYASKDFELDIIYRMIRKPWKFASEETEKYTKLEDYSNIMKYIEKYYPEIMRVPNLYKRLAIYDIVYYMKQLIEYPHISELKDDVLKAVNYLILI